MSLAAVLVVGLAVAIALAVARSHRRAKPLPAPAPLPARDLPAPSPASLALAPVERFRREAVVVFVHGFAGFGELRLGPAQAAYFRGVREHLERRGIRSAFANLPSVAPTVTRGMALAKFLNELGDVDVHLIGHSMGGLDARWVLKNAEPTNVRSLVTIATPHRGTPLADLGSVVLGRASSESRAFTRAVSDLGRSLADQADAPIVGLTCASVIVDPKDGARGVRPIFRPTHRLIEALAGANDGVVPRASQAWGDVLGVVDTDHCGVLGWAHRGAREFDAPAFYGALAASLLDGAPSLESWDPERPRIAHVETLRLTS